MQEDYCSVGNGAGRFSLRMTKQERDDCNSSLSRSRRDGAARTVHCGTVPYKCGSVDAEFGISIRVFSPKDKRQKRRGKRGKEKGKRKRKRALSIRVYLNKTPLPTKTKNSGIPIEHGGLLPRSSRRGAIICRRIDFLVSCVFTEYSSISEVASTVDINLVPALLLRPDHDCASVTHLFLSVLVFGCPVIITGLPH